MQILNSEQLNEELDLNLWPSFNMISGKVPSLQFELFVNETLSYFTGHFPEQAVLPGVVQIHWAGELAKRFFSCRGFCQLSNVKFNSVILPEMAVTLSLDYHAQNGKLKFSYSNAEQRFSSGTIVFETTQ